MDIETFQKNLELQLKKANSLELLEQLSYDREAEKDQEIGDEFLNPDKDMEDAARTIQV